MAAARRFAFVETVKAGQQRLMLANLDPVRPLRERTARITTEMDSVPGELPDGGEVPETYQDIVVRPDNAYAAVWTAQVGTDFLDFNIAIYDMNSGVRTVRFNEHSVAYVNRANCPCPLFDAFLASEAALGVPQSQIDGYDYSVIVEGTGVGQPTLTWSTTGTLIVTFDFDVVAASSFLLGQARFAFEVAVTAAPGGSVNILSRNAGVSAYSPIPPDHFALRPPPGRVVPAGPNVIYYGKQPVRFYQWFKRFWPAWLRLSWPGSTYREASIVSGFVP